MQDRLDDPPIVRCPGCDLPMEARERTPATERLVDVRYVCAGAAWKRNGFLKSGGWPSLATRRRKESLILSAANTQGPRERSRHHRGLALASQALRGLRLGSLRHRVNQDSVRRSSRPSRTQSRCWDRHADTEIRTQRYLRLPHTPISRRFGNVSVRRLAIDENRVARLFGLTVGGLFAISLILIAITL